MVSFRPPPRELVGLLLPPLAFDPVLLPSVAGGVGRWGGMAPLVLGRSINHIPPGGGADYAHHITTAPPQIFGPSCFLPLLLLLLPRKGKLKKGKREAIEVLEAAKVNVVSVKEFAAKSHVSGRNIWINFEALKIFIYMYFILIQGRKSGI